MKWPSKIDFLSIDSVFNSFQMLFNKAWLFKAHSDCFMKK